MLETIVGALLPVVVTLLLGAVAARVHDADGRAAAALNTMVLRYALPLALFVGTASTQRATLLAQGPLAGALALGTIIPYAISFAVARYAFKRDLGPATLQAQAFGFSAIPFIGLPILTPLIGPRAVVVVAVGSIIINIVLVPATLVLMAAAKEAKEGASKGAGGGSPGGEVPGGPEPAGVGAIMREAFSQPVVFAPILGLAVSLAGVPVPETIAHALLLLGGTVGGVSMFASGVILQAQKPGLSAAVAVTTLGRIVVIPAIAFGLMTLLGAGAELRREVVLALALPAASFQIILAVREGVAERENASLLLFSNVLCIPTLAAFIWLVG